jgi:uncharacterized 2Fe-2S/4Fe-4S cluster protein (DUF4445 family)
MPGCKLTFLPQQKKGTFAPGTPLRDAALELGILIDSTCAGIGTCGKCKVDVKDGVSKITSVEHEVLSPLELEKGIRLACQATVESDTVCTIPDTSLTIIENIAVDGVTGDYPLEPDIRKIPVEIPKPDLGRRFFIADGALTALRDHRIDAEPLELPAVRSLGASTRGGWGAVTAIVDEATILAFEEGDTVDQLFGVAIDIGTTTLAAKLVDLTTGAVLAVSSAGNPQSAHGADVVARIQYVVRHTGGLRKLSRFVVARLNEMVAEMTNEAGLRRSDINKVAVVGNTVMQHLLLGIDPRHLGVKPYAAACAGPLRLRASDVGLTAHPEARVYSVPNLSSYVGSDITSALVALRFLEISEPTLVIDMGTNGEMVLTDGDRIVCCSSPAGPAWEGACITWGMRASACAVERFEIVEDRVEFRTVREAAPTGICGSGLIDVIGSLLAHGIISASGRLQSRDEIDADVPETLLDRIVLGDGGTREFRIADVGENAVITVSQGDIRQVQLAKAGIAAGIHTLLGELGLTPADVRHAYIAGAFGNHIRGSDVARLGLIPGVSEDRIQFVGNAALAGAEAILRSHRARRDAETLAQRIEYVEVAARPDFEDIFIDEIPFPHYSDQNTIGDYDETTQ